MRWQLKHMNNIWLNDTLHSLFLKAYINIGQYDCGMITVNEFDIQFNLSGKISFVLVQWLQMKR